MQKIYFLKGLPASGKSTWAKEEVAKNPHGTVRVNKDDLRAMCHNSVWGKDNEKLICKIRDNIIMSALCMGRNVIVDDTNFAPVHLSQMKKIQEIVKKTSNVNVEVIEKFFDVPVEECIARDALRGDKSVGKDVIMGMYDQYLLPKELPMFQEQDSTLPSAIIVDIDGTVAKMNGRDPHEYHRVGEDLPHQDIIDLVRTLRNDHTIIFVSGRKPSCYDQTLSWLNRHYTDSPNEIQYLYLREQEDDNRKDFIFKKEIYDKYIKDKFYIKYVFDDRNQVVEMWRSLGLRVLQVAEGNF